MVQNAKRFPDFGLVPVLFALALGILAIEPVLWLVRTWRDPSYDSHGGWVALIAAGLFAWSVSSEAPDRAAPKARLAVILLIGTAAVRLAGQVLAVNTIGAAALVIDVYAIGLLCGLASRRRAVSPGWLALCFAFSLPLERILQRVIGYGLQSLSADGSCILLGALFDNVTCTGVRIVIAGVDVLVDLPCSGARSALLLLLFFCVAAAFCKPRPAQALAGLAITLGAALAANVLRISALAIGIAQPALYGGIDVMQQPWHDALGLAALLAGAIPVILWGRWSWPKSTRGAARVMPAAGASGGLVSRHRSLVLAAVFLVLAVAIVSLPRRPVDVVRRDLAIELPERLAGHRARRVALLPREKAYFVQYGGAAAKAVYGPYGLLVVRTSAPLRHLHTPDDCLRGLGFDVDYLGVAHAPVPTAIYRARAPSGRAYRVQVSFVSEKGHVTSNVAEAVWRWLQSPGGAWSMVQRIMPLDDSDTARTAWDRAVFAALDLPVVPSPTLSTAMNGASHD